MAWLTRCEACGRRFRVDPKWREWVAPLVECPQCCSTVSYFGVAITLSEEFVAACLGSIATALAIPPHLLFGPGVLVTMPKKYQLPVLAMATLYGHRPDSALLFVNPPYPKVSHWPKSETWKTPDDLLNTKTWRSH